MVDPAQFPHNLTPDNGGPDAKYAILYARACSSAGQSVGLLIAPGSAAPDPSRSLGLTNWRCPDCKGSIVRLSIGEMDDDERPWDVAPDDVRADFRCRSSTCGWADWILWPGSYTPHGV